MTRTITIAALAVILGATAATGAVVNYGPRLGYTHDDAFDQVHLGGQAWIRDLIDPNVVLLPSVELGFGDDATVFALNGDVVYEFTELAQDPWSFYAGGGLGFIRWDSGDFDDTDIGLNLVGGATYDLAGGTRELFGELRLGVEDTPDLKLTFGLNFY
jgi:hypothetical protein